jgi:hypothetical protein
MSSGTLFRGCARSAPSASPPDTRCGSGATTIEYALHTVSEVRTEDTDDVVRMGLTGRPRLGTDEFDAELDSQIVHPPMSDEHAEKCGEVVDRLHDDGAHTGLIVVAPPVVTSKCIRTIRRSASQRAWPIRV